MAVPVDAHHVTGRVGRRTLVEPAGLVLGGVERAVTAEAAARSRAMPVDNIISFLEGRPQNVVT